MLGYGGGGDAGLGAHEGGAAGVVGGASCHASSSGACWSALAHRSTGSDSAVGETPLLAWLPLLRRACGDAMLSEAL